MLAKKFLNSTIANYFNSDDLKGIIESIAAGKSLRMEIISKLDQSISQKTIMSNCKKSKSESKKIQLFINNSSAIKSCREVYKHLKLQTSLDGNHIICKEMIDYLSDHIDQFLQEKKLQIILRELHELNIHSLILKIDQHLKNKLDSLDGFSNIESQAFEDDYLLAKTFGLKILEHTLNEHYKKSLAELKLPFNGIKLSKKVTKLLGQFERLFEDHQKTYTSILHEKISSLLTKSPKFIEEIANAASSDKNTWLIDLIKLVYSKNSTILSTHWLLPLEELQPIEELDSDSS